MLNKYKVIYEVKIRDPFNFIKIQELVDVFPQFTFENREYIVHAADANDAKAITEIKFGRLYQIGVITFMSVIEVIAIENDEVMI